MPQDIKSFFHVFCSKNRFEASFSTRPTGPKNRQRFLCEVRVTGSNFPYCGVGNSTNKKDAEKNASRDFVNYLVRVGKIAENDVPQDFPEGNIPGSSNNQSQHFNNYQAPTPAAGLQEFSPNDLGQAYRPYGSHYQGPNSYMDRAQEQTNMDDAESLDVNSGIHGNYTIDNAKGKLNQFMQANKIQADYKVYFLICLY